MPAGWAQVKVYRALELQNFAAANLIYPNCEHKDNSHTVQLPSKTRSPPLIPCWLCLSETLSEGLFI